jgi:hypothetical protein
MLVSTDLHGGNLILTVLTSCYAMQNVTDDADERLLEGEKEMED